MKKTIEYDREILKKSEERFENDDSGKGRKYLRMKKMRSRRADRKRGQKSPVSPGKGSLI